MGLDIYVGSLTRYYARDWETIVQKHARESGTKLTVLRLNEPIDALTDPETIRPAILQWRENLSTGLGDNLSAPLNWNEAAEAPYFTDKPAWDCYASLLLWAAYSEQEHLQRPEECIENWTDDGAFKLSTSSTFSTKYQSLLHGAQIWLPSQFRFVFSAPNVSGETVRFGSVDALRDELTALNKKTWKAEELEIAQWRRDGAEHRAPMETGAKFAYSIFYRLANAAIENRLVMLLDY